MWKKPPATNQLTIIQQRKSFNRSLCQVLRDESFLKELHALKGYIASGRAVDECRSLMAITSQKRWNLLLDALGRLTATPEKLYIEFHTRAQARYSQVLSVLKRAQGGEYAEEVFDETDREWKTTKRRGPHDPDTEARMLLLLTKIDKQLVDLADRMGLLTMEHVGEDGDGISNAQVRKELEKLDDIINAQIAARARAVGPISIGDERRDDHGGQADQVGALPVDPDYSLRR